MRGGLALGFALAVLGCGGAPSASALGPSGDFTPSKVGSEPPSSQASLEGSPSGVTPSAALAEHEPLRAKAAVADFPFELERVFDTPIVALTVEREPHVAALSGNKAFIHTQRGWQEVPLPAHPHLAAPRAARQLFYGRDFRPRLVVNVETELGAERSYFRWLPAGFRLALDELGPLARKARPRGHGACATCIDDRLIAVLGNDDPEIICRPRDVCVVKRVTGWSTFAAPNDVSQAAIFSGKAYLVAGQALLAVEGDKGVRALAEQGPFGRARGLWVAESAFWIWDESATLYRFDGQGFRSFSSPKGAPRALYGTSDTKLWLGAEHGLARFDGERFLPVDVLSGEVTSLGGRGEDELFIGSSSGLYYAKRRP